MVEEKERRPTSNGDVGEPVSVPDVDSIGDDAQQGLGHHGEVANILYELKRGRAEVEGVHQVEVEGQPWEAPEALHPAPSTRTRTRPTTE